MKFPHYVAFATLVKMTHASTYYYVAQTKFR